MKMNARTRKAIGKRLRSYYDALKATTPDRLMELARRDFENSPHPGRNHLPATR